MDVDILIADILEQPHALIAGATGSGKSTLLDSVLDVATKLNKSYAIVDLKRVSVLRWKKHALRYATEPEDALKLIDDIILTMENRFKRMEQQEISETKEGNLYLVVDECADLLDTVKDSYTKLKRIARLGRAAHVHLILCTQSPSRKVIPADLTLNIPCRVGLRCETAIESRQTIGAPGCELLPQYGMCILKTPKGKQMLKVPKLPD